MHKLISLFALFGAVAGLFCSPQSTWAEQQVNELGEYSFSTEDGLQLEDLSSGATLLRSSSLVELGGEDRYQTVAKEALYAFDHTDTAIIASGWGYADSISAGGLAGALDCPILLTDGNSLSPVTRDALAKLSVRNVILLGSKDVVSSNVESQLRSLLGSEGSIERVSGPDRYSTQAAVYDYGVAHGLWTGDTAIVVSAIGFADALSVSPISFSKKAPVFFCDHSRTLPQRQLAALQGARQFKNVILIGSESVTSSSTLNVLQQMTSSRGGYAVRLGGPDRYLTSVAVASYAVSSLGFTWDKVAFASGQGPYDSLGGGVVQGKENSVLLLADSSSWVSSESVPVSSVGTLKFFGSTVVVPEKVRAAICARFGFSDYSGVTNAYYNISLSQMATLQVARNEGNGLTFGDFYSVLNPSTYQYGTPEYLQFAVLNAGYSGVDAETLNSFVADLCSWSEQKYGRESALRGMGDVFVEAAHTYGVNEVYLLSHAIWESGWGCSELATGWTPETDGEVVINGRIYPYRKGETYYNFFGIGAVDSNSLSGGRAMAVKEGWNSPRAAILGAAKWISSNYHNRISGRQNTLYLMKWDVAGAANTGSAWHEYCTGSNSWVLGISRVMSNCYSHAGRDFSRNQLQYSVPIYT